LQQIFLLKLMVSLSGLEKTVPKLCLKFVRNIEKYANISKNIQDLLIQKMSSQQGPPLIISAFPSFYASTVEVTGSNPVSPTTYLIYYQYIRQCFDLVN